MKLRLVIMSWVMGSLGLSHGGRVLDYIGACLESKGVALVTLGNILVVSST